VDGTKKVQRGFDLRLQQLKSPDMLLSRYSAAVASKNISFDNAVFLCSRLWAKTKAKTRRWVFAPLLGFYAAWSKLQRRVVCEGQFMLF